jgi:hypothetical protein
MTETDSRPGEGHRGDIDDQHRAGEVTRDRIPPNRRGTASWSQRHQSRVNKIFSGTDPRIGGYRDREWTDRELAAWYVTAEHLRDLGLFGRWQVPESVRHAWRRRACSCCRRWSR